MPRTKTAKEKKMTVAELKRRLNIGTRFTMVDFHGTPVNKRRVVIGFASNYVKLGGDGIKEGEYSVLNWPKAGELTGTPDGFMISYAGNGRGAIRYVWDITNDVKEETNIAQDNV